MGKGSHHWWGEGRKEESTDKRQHHGALWPWAITSQKETCHGRSTNSSGSVQQQWEEEAAVSYSTYRTVGWVSTNGETLVKERMNAGSVSRDGRVVKINNHAVSLFSIALSAQIEFWLWKHTQRQRGKKLIKSTKQCQNGFQHAMFCAYEEGNESQLNASGSPTGLKNLLKRNLVQCWKNYD